MVASEHVHFARVSQFLREQQGDHFYVVGVSVDIVALKQVRFVRWRPYLVIKAQ